MKTSLAILITTLSFLWFFNPVSAQDATGGNAAGIRVIANPNHYSALRWYEEKKFTGSPQSIVVDGYNGVRDGRTVYVNVANVTNGALNTNIYLISYNQGGGNELVDIFGKMLEHWKFNTNMIATGNCSQSNSLDCLTDSNCPTSEYCNSGKAKVTRDTIRIERLTDIKFLLTDYKETNGHFPELNAGSYIKNTTISVWPSWQDVFGKALKTKIPEDVLNDLGTCGTSVKYPKMQPNHLTCWAEKEKIFADSNPDIPTVKLPANSYAFVYETDSKGAKYNLCATMETNYSNNIEINACEVSNNRYNLSEIKTPNRPPVFSDYSLPITNSGQPFEGYIKANDPDGDDIKWEFEFNDPVGQWTNWNDSKAPVDVDTNKNNQKKIFSPKAGGKGEYIFYARIGDKESPPSDRPFTRFVINIKNSPPLVFPVSIDYLASRTNPLIIKFKAFDYPAGEDLKHKLTSGLKFVLPLIDDTIGLFGPTSFDYLFSFSGIIETNSSFDVRGNRPFNIKVWDRWGATTTKDFFVNVKNNNPKIITPLTRITTLIKGQPYPACQITATDPDGHLIDKYELVNTGGEFTIDNNGLITSTVGTVGKHKIAIKVTDEYGASSDTESYDLQVDVQSCGDGLIQPEVGENCDDGRTGNTTSCTSNTAGTCTYCDLTCHKQTVNLVPVCSDGIIQLGETCEIGVDGLTSECTPTGYGVECKYCENCQIKTKPGPKCGDGIVDAGYEVCDGNGLPCTTIATTGVPSYCSLFEAKPCKADCSGWGDTCAPPLAMAEFMTSTACSYTSPVANDYACCEIISCDKDGCGCCGRPEGAIFPSNYDVVQSLSPCSGTADSCKLSRSQANARNWSINTNHTTANYRCWRQ